jgi:hypothetical protein
MSSRARIGRETAPLLWKSTELERKNQIAHGDPRGPTEAAGVGGCSWRGAARFQRNGNQNGASMPHWTGKSGRKRHATSAAMAPRDNLYNRTFLTQTVVCSSCQAPEAAVDSPLA